MPRVALFSIMLLLGAFGSVAHEGEDTLAGHSFQGEAYSEGPRQSAYLMEGMPDIHFPVSTSNALAQKFMNQGVGQLHGFWYFEAERSFRQVAMLDTNCLMAQWGLAMANVLNEKRAREFIKQAVARTNEVKVTRREQLYIESLAKFHGIDKKELQQKTEGKKEEKNATNNARTNAPVAKANPEAENKRHRDYVRNLEQIIEEFPDDIEAKAFLCFKIWDNGGRLKISSHTATEALTQQVLASKPLHPVHHARIHFWNYEADRRALDAAAKCGQGSPGIAHMWHMPGHTYSALHRYHDAAWQQEASARVDHAYMVRNRVLPDQIHNFSHNNDWLVKNLNYLGRVEDALALAKNMVELPRHPRFNNLEKGTNTSSTLSDSTVKANQSRQNSAIFGRARLIETLITWELWDELQALGKTMYLEPTDLPEEQLKRMKALGLAAFGSGDTSAGKQWIKELQSVLKRQRDERMAEADKAEEKARAEKKPEDQVSKAMADAMLTHASRIKATQRAIAELRLYEALAKKDKEAARKLVDDTKDMPKERLSRVWLQLGERDKAVRSAKEATDGATNQVQVLANYVDVLWQAGKTNDAMKAFERLRPLCAKASLNVPVMKRLKPLVKHLELADDWRPEFKPSGDVGERPSLDALGPFRWHPAPAPAFTLEGVDGKKVSLKDYRKKPVLVIFYLGHGCKHCLEQLNAFAPANERFEKAGISILAVSTDSVSGLQKSFLQSASGDGFPFQIVSDESLATFKQYRAFDDFENTPLHGTFLVDRDGLIRWQDISYDPFTQVDFLLKESQRLLKLPVKDLPTRAESKVASASEARKDSKLADAKGRD